jgi:hypothetical protein
VKVEEILLRRKMDADDSPEILFTSEIELVINIITQTLLNPGELMKYSFIV